jgi:hypothetical protein
MPVLSSAAVANAQEIVFILMAFLLFPAFVKILHNITIHGHGLIIPRHKSYDYDQSLTPHIDLGQAEQQNVRKSRVIRYREGLSPTLLAILVA